MYNASTGDKMGQKQENASLKIDDLTKAKSQGRKKKQNKSSLHCSEREDMKDSLKRREKKHFLLKTFKLQFSPGE